MTLGEQQRECRDCGTAFIPKLRHPNQITCGAKCKGRWSERGSRVLARYKHLYRTDEKFRLTRVYRSWRYKLKKAYGLTPEQYDQMVKDQQGVCAICKTPAEATTVLGNVKIALLVDHDHKTGKVRQLLCYGCNGALGYLKENPETALALIDYLKRHSSG